MHSDEECFTCPDCGMSEAELDKLGHHKPGCPNPAKATALLKSLFGNLIPIIDPSDNDEKSEVEAALNENIQELAGKSVPVTFLIYDTYRMLPEWIRVKCEMRRVSDDIHNLIKDLVAKGYLIPNGVDVICPNPIG